MINKTLSITEIEGDILNLLEGKIYTDLPFNEQYWVNWIFIWEKMYLDSYLMPHKISLRLRADLNVKVKI